VSIDTAILAAVTHWLPGPKILSTLLTLSVPYAIDAIAWAPPCPQSISQRPQPKRKRQRTARTIWSAPHLAAMYTISGRTRPSASAGVATVMEAQPAIEAGMQSMSAVEGRTAVPPGM
jgi:hypothetical protein